MPGISSYYSSLAPANTGVVATAVEHLMLAPKLHACSTHTLCSLFWATPLSTVVCIVQYLHASILVVLHLQSIVHNNICWAAAAQWFTPLPQGYTIGAAAAAAAACNAILWLLLPCCFHASLGSAQACCLCRTTCFAEQHAVFAANESFQQSGCGCRVLFNVICVQVDWLWLPAELSSQLNHVSTNFLQGALRAMMTDLSHPSVI